MEKWVQQVKENGGHWHEFQSKLLTIIEPMLQPISKIITQLVTTTKRKINDEEVDQMIGINPKFIGYKLQINVVPLFDFVNNPQF